MHSYALARTNLQCLNCVLEELVWSPGEDASQGSLDQCVAAHYPLAQTLQSDSNLHTTIIKILPSLSVTYYNDREVLSCGL
jgi:hypothetical protein